MAESADAVHGVIATVIESGARRDFVTSGFTEEGQRAMEGWPDGHRLFGHLHALGAPLRLPGPLPCSARYRRL